MTRSRGGGDELQGGGGGDDELQSRGSNDDEQAAATTSFRHDGGAVGQGLVLGFTSDTLSFHLGMGLV